MLPWGTPCVTGNISDNSVLQDVHCKRPLRYDLNHLAASEVGHKEDNLRSKIVWSTVSKALDRSKNTAPHSLPLSIFGRISSARLEIAKIVGYVRRNPNCLSLSKLCLSVINKTSRVSAVSVHTTTKTGKPTQGNAGSNETIIFIASGITAFSLLLVSSLVVGFFCYRRLHRKRVER